MPHVDVAGSPLAPRASPVTVHYRDAGVGHPIVILHGGWGYEIYPCDRLIAALSPRHRVVIPDRTGYGRSGAIEWFPTDFHRRAMEETHAVVNALGLERPILFGHSDGAIIALLLALESPAVACAVIAEATHLFRRKPRSRSFFESVAANAESLGETVASVLARDHGDRWRRVLALHADAWLRIAEEAASGADDFYGGRLGEVAVPVLLIHGARDPRTEPGELEALRAALRSGSDRQEHVREI